MPDTVRAVKTRRGARVRRGRSPRARTRPRRAPRRSPRSSPVPARPRSIPFDDDRGDRRRRHRGARADGRGPRPRRRRRAGRRRRPALGHGARDARHAPATRVIGAEPVLADDAARSLATGELQPPLPPTTIADGLLTGLSERTFAIIREHVDDHRHGRPKRRSSTRCRRSGSYTKQLIEPSAAVAVAAVQQHALAGARRRRHRVGRQRRPRPDVRDAALSLRTAEFSARGTRGCASRRTRPCPLAGLRSRTRGLRARRSPRAAAC